MTGGGGEARLSEMSSHFSLCQIFFVFVNEMGRLNSKSLGNIYEILRCGGRKDETPVNWKERGSTKWSFNGSFNFLRWQLLYRPRYLAHWYWLHFFRNLLTGHESKLLCLRPLRPLISFYSLSMGFRGETEKLEEEWRSCANKSEWILRENNKAE